MATIDPSARTTDAELTEIIETDLSAAQRAAFINSAFHLVEDQLTGKGLSADILGEIEKYLAAHFLSVRDQRAAREDIGSEYSVTYQGKTDMGLQATHYGQMALTLDPSGTLARLSSSPKRAKFTVYGEDD